MLIRHMWAVFGRLKGEGLTLQEGLNIVRAPNETGKSTWCAFLSSMLYGVNTRERDRADALADKNRFAPWSGEAMKGRLECCAGGREITVTRETRRQNAPLGDFQAVYTGTAEAVEGLDAAGCGQRLIGVSREVYERSAFIRQSGLAITQDAGLEKRIAALMSSGEEDTSYTEAAEALKKRMHSLRYNKRGRIPDIEEQLEQQRQRLEQSGALQDQLRQLQEQVQTLEEQSEALKRTQDDHRRWEAHQGLQRRQELLGLQAQCAQKVRDLEKAQGADACPRAEDIGHLQEAIGFLEGLRPALTQARKDAAAAQQDAQEARRAARSAPALPPPRPEAFDREDGGQRYVLPVSAAIAAAVFALVLWKTLPYISQFSPALLLPFGAALMVVLGGVFIHRLMAAQRPRRSAGMDEMLRWADAYEQGGASPAATADIEAQAQQKAAAAEDLAQQYARQQEEILQEVRRFAPETADIPGARQALEAAAQRQSREQDDLHRARTALAEARARLEELPLWEPLQDGHTPTAPPPGDPEAIAHQLQQTQAQLEAARSGADRLLGRLHESGEMEEIKSVCQGLQEQLAALEEEYAAVQLALETLDAANADIQRRFSPALSRRTAEIFRELTGGRYSAAALDRQLRLTARSEGDPVDRDILYLSAGAADQLYLAARLAICQLVLPQDDPPPLVLDDALANFDDERCAAALRWLRQEAAHRQIILLTCHSREAAFFEHDRDVACLCLGGEA